MTPHKYQRVAALVRSQIADGTLAPGAPAPSGAALSRITGYSLLTCRRALRTLVIDGVLAPGAGPSARPRVPGVDHGDRTLGDAKRALSAALAKHRRAAGLTQPQLAKLIGQSVTSVGHAETGRLWQSRPFWEYVDGALNAGGELRRLHDAYRAAEVPSEPATETETEDTPPETNPAESPLLVTVDTPQSVRCITITWADGTLTVAYPPDTKHLASAEEEQHKIL